MSILGGWREGIYVRDTRQSDFLVRELLRLGVERSPRDSFFWPDLGGIPILKSPVVPDGQAYFVTEDGRIHVLKFEQRLPYQLPGRPRERLGGKAVESAGANRARNQVGSKRGADSRPLDCCRRPNPNPGDGKEDET